MKGRQPAAPRLPITDAWAPRGRSRRSNDMMSPLHSKGAPPTSDGSINAAAPTTAAAPAVGAVACVRESMERASEMQVRASEAEVYVLLPGDDRGAKKGRKASSPSLTSTIKC